MSTDKKNNDKNIKDFFNEKGVFDHIPLETRMKLMGEVTSLLLSSSLHRKYLINDIASIFMPAIHLNQFKIYKVNKVPVGIITWGYFSDEIERKFIDGQYPVKLADWKSGKNGWVMDFIAPFGHASGILKDFRNNIFPHESGKILRIDKNGNRKGVRNIHGAKFKTP